MPGGPLLRRVSAAGEGPEADALKAQARLALRAAAERAAALGSHEQAITFLEQALEVTTDPADRADLHQRALTSAYEGLSAEVAIRHAEGQLAARRELGDREAIALATADFARAVSSMLGDPVRALQISEKAWEEFSDLEGTRAGVTLMMGMGAQHGTLGRTAEYAQWLERVIPIAERLDLIDPLTGAFVGLGSALMETGRPRQGLLLMRGAHELAMKHGLRRRERGARQGLMFWEQWNEPAEGVRLGREGLQIARQIGSQAYVFAMIGNAVVCAIRVGEWDWALEILREWTPAETEVAQFAELFGDQAVLAALRGEDPTTLAGSRNDDDLGADGSAIPSLRRLVPGVGGIQRRPFPRRRD